MSYYQLYYHIVFGTKGRRSLIPPAYRRDLYAYIYGICKQNKWALHRINGMSDHVHMLITIPPAVSISKAVKDIKQYSSTWARQHTHLGATWYGWGKGYAVKSYSVSELEVVKNYIINQEAHHRGISFYDEYKHFVEGMGYAFVDEEG